MLKHALFLLVLVSALTGCATSEEELARQRAQQQWWNSLTPDQQVQLEAARLRALGMALSGSGPFLVQPYAPPPRPTYAAPRCHYGELMINGQLGSYCD